MKAAVQGIIIFRLTLGAHLKVAHGGFGAVIRHILNYGKAWATIGAVGKGIAVAAVFGIQQLAKASWAGCHIRRDKLIFPCLCLALPNFKVFIAARLVIFNGYVLNVSQGWGFGLEVSLELLNSFCCTFYLNPDILRSVVNPALKVVLNSQSINERSEADALNNAPDANRG
jgi:hypothetical protein